MHDILLKEYFGIRQVEFNGKIYEVPRRTTTTNEEGKREVLPQEEMSKFMEFGKSLAANMGVPTDG